MARSRNMVLDDLGCASATPVTFFQLALLKCLLDTQVSSEVGTGNERNTVPHLSVGEVVGLNLPDFTCLHAELQGSATESREWSRVHYEVGNRTPKNPKVT